MRKKILYTLLCSTLIASCLFTGCNKTEDPQQPIEDQQVEDTSPVIYTPNLNDIKVELIDYKNIDTSSIQKHILTEEDVQEQIDFLCEQYSEEKYYEMGTLKDGDIAYISFTGAIDGDIVEDACSQGVSIKIGSNTNLEGLEESLIGKEVGEEYEITLKAPDNISEEYKGKDIVFQIKVLYIVELIPQTWDDEFVRSEFEYASTEDYEEFLRKDMAEFYEAQYKQEIETHILKTLVENCRFDNLTQEKIDAYYNEGLNYYKTLAENEQMELETFVVTYMGYENLATFEEDLKEMALYDLKYKYALLAIAEQENIALTQNDFDEYVEITSTYYGVDEEQFLEGLKEENNNNMNVIYESILCNKIIETFTK